MTLQQADSAADAFRDELDRNFRVPLTAYFLKRVGNRSEAEDLTQDVFLRTLRQVGELDASRAKAYIFTVAANLLRDRARQAATRQTQTCATLDDPADPANVELIENRSPERVYIGKQTLQEVLTALEGLSERTRDIFVLYRIEQMKQHEIAALLGVSLSTVEKNILKAVALLTERFEQT